MSTHNIYFHGEKSRNIYVATILIWIYAVVGLFELEFYGPVNAFKIMLSWSVNQLKLFQDRLGPRFNQLTSTCAHTFASNWQVPFLNQQKREKWFHDQSPQKLCGWAGIPICDPRICRQTWLVCLFDLGLTSLSTFFSHIATVSGCGRELNAHF